MRKFLVQQCWIINLLTYSENVWKTDKNIVIAIIFFFLF